MKPSGLRAARTANAITLQWDASARTANYQVVRRSTSRPDEPLLFPPTTSTTLVDSSVVRAESYTYVVHAMSPNGDTASDGILIGPAPTPPPPPASLQAFGRAKAIDLGWGFVSYPVSVLRSTTPGGPYTDVAVVNPRASYSDTGLADGTTYYYVVKGLASDGFPGDPSSEASATTAPAAPTGLAATLVDFTSNAIIRWDPVPGATGYCVKFFNSSCSFPNATDTSLTVSLLAGATSDVRVSAVVPGAFFLLEGPDAGPIQILAPLRGPDLPTIVSHPPASGFDLSWTPVPGAISYVVVRGVDGAPAVPIATIPGTTFTDDAVRPWTHYQYQVASVDSRNAIGEPGFAGVALTTGLPDQQNLGVQDTLVAATVDGAHEVAQTFTVGQAGLLAAIELSGTFASFDGNAAVDVFDGPQILGTGFGDLFFGPCCAPLAGGPPQSSFFQFLDGGIPVSVGQTLRFRVRSGFGQLLFARGGDGYAGGSLEAGGRADPTSDLLFKTYVKTPDVPLTSMGALAAFPGLGRVTLTWGALPSAASYSVLGSDGAGGPFSSIATTTQTNFAVDAVAPGTSAFYSVEAKDASGTTLASTLAVPAAPLPSSVDQSNAGDGSGFALADEFAGSFAGQSFTVGRTGTLAGFQFSALAADGGAIGLDTVTVKVLDEAGNVLLSRSVLLQLEGGCCGVAGPPPIDQTSFALQTVDVSEVQLQVTTGEVLRFEVHSFNPMQIGDSADVYAGGSESVNGVAIPGRDLAFQVLVQ